MAKKRLQVVLTQDVPQLGQKGELKSVAPGFARNFLLARNLAILATADIVQKVQLEEIQKQKELVKGQELARKLAQELAGKSFKLALKASPEGRLYAAVGEKEILELLKAGNFEISGIKMLSRPIKQTGEHKIELDLGHGQKACFNLKVAPKALKAKVKAKTEFNSVNRVKP
jgi:large subunit ribosomal protein L9